MMCKARAWSTWQGGLDFQDLLEQHPDAVMEYIVKRGTKLLGTFKCKVQTTPCCATHTSMGAQVNHCSKRAVNSVDMHG